MKYRMQPLKFVRAFVSSFHTALSMCRLIHARIKVQRGQKGKASSFFIMSVINRYKICTGVTNKRRLPITHINNKMQHILCLIYDVLMAQNMCMDRYS